MQRDEIARLLPEIFQRTLPREISGAEAQHNALSALLGVMEQLHARDEEILDRLDEYFDPNRVPVQNAGPDRAPLVKAADFLPFLARWVDLDWLLPESGEYEAGLNCLRNLILAAPHLASLRGTRKGLEQFLEAATGIHGFQVMEDLDRPFTILITCPLGAKQFYPLVERIIAGEKPVYVKCELTFSKSISQPGMTGRPG